MDIVLNARNSMDYMRKTILVCNVMIKKQPLAFTYTQTFGYSLQSNIKLFPAFLNTMLALLMNASDVNHLAAIVLLRLNALPALVVSQ
jgi:hypothetical protein